MSAEYRSANPFPEEEPPTQRRGILIGLISQISQLEAKAEELLTLLQKEGLTNETKIKTSDALFQIRTIVLELEEGLGLYRSIEPNSRLKPPPVVESMNPPPRKPFRPY